MELDSDKIKSELRRRKLNTKDLAVMIGKDNITVIALLKKRSTTLATISKIGKAIDIDPRDLLIVH